MTAFVAAAHPYISMAEVADLLNAAARGRSSWDAERVRRWLQRRGAVEKIGGRWYTTREQLRDSFPRAWDEISLRLPDAEEDETQETQ